MIIFNNIKDYSKTSYKSCAALGFFDGVHVGHKKVLNECLKNKEKLKSVLLTFTDPPAKSLGRPFSKLINNDQKAKMVQEIGIDCIIFSDFNKIKDLSPKEFVNDILIKRLNVKKIFTGFNYRFGKNGEGDTDLLSKLCKEKNIPVYISDPVKCNDSVVSSSIIKEKLSKGDLTNANKMLGYNFFYEGIIVKGRGNGHSLSSPTVNIPIKEETVKPRFGVYKTRATIDGISYMGATNIGIHPTVGSSLPLCETYLINYCGADLYGKTAKIELTDFIRDEIKFSSKEELKSQIEKDIKTILSYHDGKN